jgi:glucosamine-phosphate N-acetyltransferase
MLFRTIENTDYLQYSKLINDFRETSFSYEEFESILKYIKQTGDIWLLIVDGIMVATGTIFFEKKLIFNTCTLAHVEDVCVAKTYRGKGYGKNMMSHLIAQAKSHGCYKITLDCNDSNVGFYESCRLTRRGNQMCELLENL